MKARVIVQPDADEQALTIDTWWRENRPAAPSLFADELVAAFGLLAEGPGAGACTLRGTSTPWCYSVTFWERGDLPKGSSFGPDPK